jgi:hypothetical protein
LWKPHPSVTTVIQQQHSNSLYGGLLHDVEVHKKARHASMMCNISYTSFFQCLSDDDDHGNAGLYAGEIQAVALHKNVYVANHAMALRSRGLL